MSDFDFLIDPKFNPVSNLMRLAHRTIPWLEIQLYQSMRRPNRTNKKEKAILMRYDDYSVWLEEIIFRIERRPYFYIKILDESSVPYAPSCDSRIHRRHPYQSFVSVVRTIIQELIEATEEPWVADSEKAEKYENELERLLIRFPLRPVVYIEAPRPPQR